MEHIITKNEIDIINKLCHSHEIDNYTINNDGSIDVDGSVDISRLGIEWLPIKFNIVNGDFTVVYSKIYDFHNFPKQVNGNLIIFKNHFRSMNGFDTIVSGNIDISNNGLTSLKGLPKKINGYLNVRENNIDSLVGCPKEIKGYFDIAENYIKTLDNFPKVGGSVDISYNKITTLKGLPKTINGSLSFNGTNIETLEYIPIISGKISLNNLNRLKSFYSGDVDLPTISSFGGVFSFVKCPEVIKDNIEHLILILKYQRHFEIWNSDASLNYEHFQELIDEINDGLL